MKIQSTKPRGQRIFKCQSWRRKDGKIVKRPFCIEPYQCDSLWFDKTQNGWFTSDNIQATSYSSAYYGKGNRAYSLKAVLRRIRSWEYPPGTKFIANLPWVGYGFIITP